MKTAIITGASSGIGEATAKTLAENGFNVTLVARRESLLVNLKEKLESEGHFAIVSAGDVAIREDLEKAANQTMKNWGRIDLLVNNAGIMPLSFMKNLYLDEWQQMIDVNIIGVLNGINSVLPVMKKQNSGHIINISSVAGVKVMPGASVYCGTKYAVEAITEGLRQELSAAHGIRTTVIRPGAIETNIMSTITDPEIMPFLAKGALGEFSFIKPKTIADAIMYSVNQPPDVSVNEILIRPTSQMF